MLKFSKVILHLTALNLSVFLSFSFAYADIIDESKADTSTSNVKQDSIISHNIVNQICRNSDAAILESKGSWYRVSINGNSGWVHGMAFPVESIKAVQNSKATAKTEEITDKDKSGDTDKGQEVSTEGTDKTDNAQEASTGQTEKTDNAQTAVTEEKGSVIKGIIDGYNVNVRKGSGKDYGVICQVNTGDTVEILELEAEWYHITTSSGVDGWISSSYVVAGTTLASRGSTADTNTTNKRSEIVLFAKEFLGVKYVYGGTSPKGFDCSGFVWYVFNHFGIKLNRVASDQATQGTKVAKSELEPGDLVFFNSPNNKNGIGHAGIYIGNGSFIHASSGSSAKVIISDLNSGTYKSRYVTGRKILE